MIGSLCSGYGGLDLAVEAVFGQSVAWHCEIDPAPSRVLEAHWSGVPNLRDLTEVDWGSVEPVEIIAASYPCTPFSHAGQRKGADDERHLWPYVAEAVRRIRPRLVCLENVAGHRSLGFDVVLGDLAAMRYDVRWTSLRAADVGAPHGRERVFLVAADARGTHRGADRREGRRAELGPTAATAADAAGSRLERRPDQHGREPDAGRGDAGLPPTRCGEVGQGRSVAADTGRGPFPRTAAAGDGLRLAAERCDRPAADTDGDGRESVGRVDTLRRDPHRRDHPHTAWGKYEPAIRRWERVLGRAAPPPHPPNPDPRVDNDSPPGLWNG